MHCAVLGVGMAVLAVACCSTGRHDAAISPALSPRGATRRTCDAAATEATTGPAGAAGSPAYADIVEAARSNAWGDVRRRMDAGEDPDALPPLLPDIALAEDWRRVGALRSNADYVLLLAARDAEHGIVRHMVARWPGLSDAAVAMAVDALLAEAWESPEALAVLREPSMSAVRFANTAAAAFDYAVANGEGWIVRELDECAALRGLPALSAATLAALPGLHAVPPPLLALDADAAMQRHYPPMQPAEVADALQAVGLCDSDARGAALVWAAARRRWRLVHTLVAGGAVPETRVEYLPCGIGAIDVRALARLPGSAGGLAVLAAAAAHGDVVLLRYLFARARQLGVDLAAAREALPVFALHGGAVDAALWIVGELCPPADAGGAVRAVLEEAARRMLFSAVAAVVQRHCAQGAGMGILHVAATVIRVHSARAPNRLPLLRHLGLSPADMARAFRIAIDEALAENDAPLAVSLLSKSDSYAAMHLTPLAVRVWDAVRRRDTEAVALLLAPDGVGPDKRGYLAAEAAHRAVGEDLVELFRLLLAQMGDAAGALAGEHAVTWLYRAGLSRSESMYRAVIGSVPPAARAAAAAQALHMALVVAPDPMAIKAASMALAAAADEDAAAAMLRHALPAAMTRGGEELVSHVAGLCVAHLGPDALRAVVTETLQRWASNRWAPHVARLIGALRSSPPLQQDVLCTVLRRVVARDSMGDMRAALAHPAWRGDVRLAALHDIAKTAAASNAAAVLFRVTRVYPLEAGEGVAWAVGPDTVDLVFGGYSMAGLVALQRRATTTDSGPNYASVSAAIQSRLERFGPPAYHLQCDIAENIAMRRAFEAAQGAARGAARGAVARGEQE